MKRRPRKVNIKMYLEKKPVAILNSGRKQIIDWRGLPLWIRLRVSFALIFYGYVDIQWKENNILNINQKRK